MSTSTWRPWRCASLLLLTSSATNGPRKSLGTDSFTSAILQVLRYSETCVTSRHTKSRRDLSQAISLSWCSSTARFWDSSLFISPTTLPCSLVVPSLTSL